MILYINAFNISFPAVEVTSKNKHLKREPWITLGLIKSSKTKAKLFAKKLSTPSDHNVKNIQGIQYNSQTTTAQNESNVLPKYIRRT